MKIFVDILHCKYNYDYTVRLESYCHALHWPTPLVYCAEGSFIVFLHVIMYCRYNIDVLLLYYHTTTTFRALSVSVQVAQDSCEGPERVQGNTLHRCRGVTALGAHAIIIFCTNVYLLHLF
jgi:hypothetical protein